MSRARPLFLMLLSEPTHYQHYSECFHSEHERETISQRDKQELLSTQSAILG